MLTKKVRIFIAIMLLLPVAYVAINFPIVRFYNQQMSMQGYIGYNVVFPLLTAIIPAAIGYFFMFRKNKVVLALIMVAIAFCIGALLTALFGFVFIPSGPFQNNIGFVEDLFLMWYLPVSYLIAVSIAGLCIRRL